MPRTYGVLPVCWEESRVALALGWEKLKHLSMYKLPLAMREPGRRCVWDSVACNLSLIKYRKFCGWIEPLFNSIVKSNETIATDEI